jgi:hypothetical protein
MLVFDGMLVEPAKQAGISVPEDLECYDPNEFPHWDVFRKVQLGAPMPDFTAHWDNAEVIAAIPEDKIREVTYDDLLERGLAVGFPIP